MSWNPGLGARNIPGLLQTSGYHIMVLQAAVAPDPGAWPSEEWAAGLASQQFFCNAEAHGRLLRGVARDP
eukprot:2790748-Prorocentrum_lima.AAC.1